MGRVDVKAPSVLSLVSSVLLSAVVTNSWYPVTLLVATLISTDLWSKVLLFGFRFNTTSLVAIPPEVTSIVSVGAMLTLKSTVSGLVAVARPPPH